ncbi:hypothetical protein FHG87_003299 [Trinorchestia longiramus]|nr:hypothetical protein FHG87_003299 [Trinorchestia longiramus]
MTCGMWVEMESCKGLTKMSVSEGNPLVLDCCKCMAVVKVKMEEEIESLKAKIVFFLRSELEEVRKLKGEMNEEDTRSKRELNGEANDVA